MGIPAGNLRETIRIQKQIVVTDEYGYSGNPTYSDYLTLRSQVRFISGTKLIDNNQLFNSQVIEFTTYYRKNIDVTDRIKWNDKYYKINAIDIIGINEGLKFSTELIQGI